MDVAAGSTVCTQSSRHNTYRHYYITAEGRVQRGVGMQYLEQANRALSSSVRNTGGGWQMTATIHRTTSGKVGGARVGRVGNNSKN